MVGKDNSKMKSVSLTVVFSDEKEIETMWGPIEKGKRIEICDNQAEVLFENYEKSLGFDGGIVLNMTIDFLRDISIGLLANALWNKLSSANQISIAGKRTRVTKESFVNRFIEGAENDKGSVKPTNKGNNKVFSIISIILGIIILVSFFSLAIIISFCKESILNKIVVLVYIIASMLYIFLLMLPRDKTDFSFKKQHIASFLLWCLIVPILAGVFVTVMINTFVSKTIDLDAPLLATGVITIFLIVFVALWFLTKIFNYSESVSKLDIYSTVWISIITVLLELIDGDFIKKEFIVVLTLFFAIQVLIKYRTYRESSI